MSYKLNLDKLVPIFQTLIEKEKFLVSVSDKSTNKKKATPENPNTNFFNQATIVMKSSVTDRNVNIKFFNNGSISMTGCKEDEDGSDCIENFLKIAKRYPEIFYSKQERQTIKILNYRITMINANYSIGFKVDRSKLLKLVKNNYPIYIDYDPNRYQGVKVSYMWNKDNDLKDGLCKGHPQKCKYTKNQRKKNICKIVTIAIFQSGNIIVTGANDYRQTVEAYHYINKLLYENYEEIVKFSVLDF